MWLVQKIGLDAYGSIDRVQWQEADLEQNKWIGHPRVAPLIAVVHEILKSGVATHYPGLGSTMLGPWLRTVAIDGGREPIAVDNDRSPGEKRSLFDLPRL